MTTYAGTSEDDTQWAYTCSQFYHWNVNSSQWVLMWSRVASYPPGNLGYNPYDVLNDFTQLTGMSLPKGWIASVKWVYIKLIYPNAGWHVRDSLQEYVY